ncbi:MAG: calcium/sodium antiporter [Candidatus Magasanikbacteria bacterium]
MIIPLLIIFAGLAVLIVGAEMLVRGSASMAKKLGVSSIVIGLTVVAFGTSAPELFVNLFSAYKGTTDLAIGNIIGSNMANILLILGVGATMTAIKVKAGTTYKEIPFALLAMILVAVFGNDLFLDGNSSNILSRTDGLALMGFFIIFLYYTYGLSKASGDDQKVELYPWATSLLMVIGGLVALILGGKLIVENAIILATIAGMSEALIGLTIVAVGTSLPELATTIVALRKGQNDIAIGNVVGSNIFNVFWILGVTAIIKPLPFDTAANIDVLFTTIITLLLFAFMFIGKKHTLERWQGICFLFLYVGYVTYAVMR